MQRGCVQRNSRKQGPDIWQFRWSETRLDGKRLYHKKIIGTVEQYPDENAARRAVLGLVSEINTDGPSTNPGAIVDQFELLRNEECRMKGEHALQLKAIRSWNPMGRVCRVSARRPCGGE